MQRTYTILVHFEHEDGFVTHSTMSGSKLTSVLASSETEAEQKAEKKVKELEGHSYDFA